jgi:DNA modification methylase
MKSLPSGCVDAVITDPPYNVGKDYGVHNDSMPPGEYETWMESVSLECLRIAQNQAWIAPRYKLEKFMRWIPKSHLVVIRRSAAGPFREGWSDQFEIALARGVPQKCMSDLWSDVRLKGEGYFFREETFGHPGYTPQPIMERFIDLLCIETVLDPFMGTGTTAVAAKKLGRHFLGFEISEEYCRIARERIALVEAQPNLFEKKPEQLQLLRQTRKNEEMP